MSAATLSSSSSPPSSPGGGRAVDGPTVTVELAIGSPLRLVGFPAGDGIGPFVTLQLGSGLTVFVHQVETAARLAEVATQLVRELRRLAVVETGEPGSPDGRAGVEP